MSPNFIWPLSVDLDDQVQVLVDGDARVGAGHDGRLALLDDGGAGELGARGERVAVVDRAGGEAGLREVDLPGALAGIALPGGLAAEVELDIRDGGGRGQPPAHRLYGHVRDAALEELRVGGKEALLEIVPRAGAERALGEGHGNLEALPDVAHVGRAPQRQLGRIGAGFDEEGPRVIV